MIPRTYGHVGVPVRFKGNAYDFGHRISAIQFSLDDGAHWTTYETPGTNDYQNLTWTFDYTPERAGFYVLRVRSVNDAGDVSPEAAFAELQVDE
ncbi:MAG: molybdopterin-binding protein [Eggerthellaceae bacterium]|nr:molybdopterin-binding protein [Eggerthellaceae bacterium]